MGNINDKERTGILSRGKDEKSVSREKFRNGYTTKTVKRYSMPKKKEDGYGNSQHLMQRSDSVPKLRRVLTPVYMPVQ